MEKAKKPKVWKPFFIFYTKFKIPWWMFIIAMVLGIVNAELILRLSKYTILINKGELYNSTILGYVFITVINSIIALFQNMMTAYGSEKVILRAREIIWRKIIHIPMKQFDKEQPSSLVSGVTISVEQASTTITMISLFSSSVYGFIKAYIIIYKYNAALTTYLFLLIPLAVAVFFIVGRLQYKVMKKKYYASKKMTEFFSEHLSSAKFVKTQAIEEYEIEEGYKAINTQYKAGIYSAFMSAIQVSINSIYTNLCTVFIAVIGSSMIRKREMEPTGINTFNTYTTNVNQYLSEILTDYQDIKGTQGVLEHANRILDMDEENMEDVKKIDNNCEEKNIIFKNVSFEYNKGNEIFNNLSLLIPYGKTTAIVGDNGGGKSTLFKLLLRLYTPTSGTIYLGEGKDISEYNLENLRQQFSYVCQDSLILDGTVRENILYGLERQASDDEVIRAAKLANAHDFIINLPRGYDTNVGEGGGKLSGGQKQRIAIARAIIQEPNYLLLDEAKANLDYQSRDSIKYAIETLMKGKTTVFISHDMKEVIEADNIIVLNDGRLEASGTHKELLMTSQTYKEYIEKYGLLERSAI